MSRWRKGTKKMSICFPIIGLVLLLTLISLPESVSIEFDEFLILLLVSVGMLVFGLAMLYYNCKRGR